MACFFGDGASNEGSFHESLNIAGAFALPVVYICENNLYGVGTRHENVSGVREIASRAASYGMPGISVDGNDALAVFESAQQAVERARRGEGPSLIECKTYRWSTHFEGEPDTYRPPEEVKQWLAHEPLGIYRQKMQEMGIVSPEEMDRIEAAVIKELDEAVEFARNSKFPEPEEALEDLWA